MRSLSPGDELRYRNGLQNESQYHNRTYIGQISTIDTETGLAKVTIGMAGKSEEIVIPLTGLSVNGIKSSWQRYMPQANDFVLVSFGPDNRPVCLGYTAFSYNPDVEPTNARRVSGSKYFNGGYARISELRKDEVAGFREFAQLKEGEWDMRSSGNAYIKGAANGALIVRGGNSQLIFDKNNYDARMTTGMFEYQDGGTHWRLGDTKRTGDDEARPKPTEEPGKAWELDIRYQVTPEPADTYDYYFQERIGDVRDDDGEREEGPHGEELVHRATYRDGKLSSPDTLDTPFTSEIRYEFTVDKAGNMDMTFHEDTEYWTIVGENLNWEAETKTLNFDCSETVDINAGTKMVLNAGATAELTAGGTVWLGSSGVIDPLILSTIYRAAEDATFTALGAAHQLLGPALTNIGAFMTAYATANPGTPDGAAATAAAAPAASAGPACLAAGAQTTAFTAAAASYLSTKVFTE